MLAFESRLAAVAILAVLTGGAIAGVIVGTGASEVLNGTALSDSLNGEGGNDVLIGGAGDDLLSGGLGFDVVFVKALKRPLLNVGAGSGTVTSPDGTDTIDASVEQLRFIDDSELLVELEEPMLTADDVLLLPAWTSTTDRPVSIVITSTAGAISGVAVSGGGDTFSLGAPAGGRLAAIDLGSVVGTVSIAGVAFEAASDLPTDGTAVSSNVGRIIFDDASTSIVVNGRAADRFKALFVTYDPLYVEGIPPEARYYANFQFLKLGVEYAQYLDGGGAPLTDFIVKTIGQRNQTLHDNLLGNIVGSVMSGRLSRSEYPTAVLSAVQNLSGLLAAYVVGTAGQRYLDRPYHDGIASKPAAETSAQWDVVNGLARDYSIVNNTVLLGRDADNDGSIDTIASQASVQAAIAAATDGNTIALAGGTYPQALTLTKPLTIRGIAGVHAALDPPDTQRALTIQAASGDSDGLGGNVTLENLYIEGASSGVHVMASARIGTLTLQHVSIANNSNFGLFVQGDGTGPAGQNGASAVVIRDSAFADNGFLTTPTNLNGASHVKLYGFTANATLSRVMVTGTRTGTSRADYGIDLVGVPNPSLAQVVPTTRLGVVRLTDVTVNGTFEKNAFAVYNYGDVDRLSIESLDISDVVTGWGYVLNFDGITASFDASQFDMALPTGTLLQTALQGDKPPDQLSTDQRIVGTVFNDLLRGKQGADILEGGAGNDQLDGGPQADTLRGGPGDDRLYGGDDASTDLLFGGSGTDEAVLPGHAADYQITYQTLSADPEGDGANAAVLATKVTRLSGGAISYLYGVERCSFVNDVAAYLASGVGLNDAVAAGPIVDETHGFGYATLQEAVAVAAPDSVIHVTGARDLTSEGVIAITQDGVTVQGSTGTTVAGFTLGVGVTTFKLAGDFAANVTGNSGANRIYGNAGANIIDGAGGNDVLVGGGGGDRLMGGAGADLIASMAANDVVLGGADDDRIVIAGSSGGAVTIAGGSGSDIFIVGAIDPLQSVQLGATIVDFVQGKDKLDLGDLHKQGLMPTLSMLALGSPSTTTSVGLAGFGIDGGTGAVTGSVVLYLLDQRVLSSSDFVFEDNQETWRVELGITP